MWYFSHHRTLKALALSSLGSNQLFSLMNYGSTNWLEGIIYSLIVLKARNLVPHMLVLAFLFQIPVGFINEYFYGEGSASWSGAIYMFLIYLPLTTISVIALFLDKMVNTP